MSEAFDFAELGIDEAELIREAQRARAARARLARDDSAEFAAFILRDEETGGPIANAPFHAEMHALLAEHDRCIFWAHIESGKTQSVSIARSVWKLGRNPNRRIAIVSATDFQATKIVGSIAQHIASNPRVHEVFPHLRPGRRWGESKITVDRPEIAKDPSVQACGLDGRGVIGSRVDDLIFDDALNRVNTRTVESRKETEARIAASFAGRLTRRSQVVWLNTAWHPKDPMHLRAARKGWISRRYPVRDRKTGVLNWPEQWTLERIAKQEAEFLGPYTPESRRQLYCEAVGDEVQHFEEAWIQKALAEGLAADNGHGIDFVPYLTHDDRAAIIRAGGMVVLSLDPAAAKRKRRRANAKSIFTALWIDGNGRRQPLAIEGGELKSPEIRDRAINLFDRFGAPLYVEDNGVQSWMVDLIAEKSAMPVLTFHTGINKHDPAFGVETIGTEMAAGKWLFPSFWDPSVSRIEPIGAIADLCDDLRNYSRLTHTGDYLMSLWIAREGGRILLAAGAGGAQASMAGGRDDD